MLLPALHLLPYDLHLHLRAPFLSSSWNRQMYNSIKKRKENTFGLHLHYDILKERYITSISSKEHPSSRSQLANIDVIMKKIQNTYMTSIFTKINRKNKYDSHLPQRAACLSGISWSIFFMFQRSFNSFQKHFTWDENMHQEKCL